MYISCTLTYISLYKNSIYIPYQESISRRGRKILTDYKPAFTPSFVEPTTSVTICSFYITLPHGPHAFSRVQTNIHTNTQYIYIYIYDYVREKRTHNNININIDWLIMSLETPIYIIYAYTVILLNSTLPLISDSHFENIEYNSII